MFPLGILGGILVILKSLPGLIAFLIVIFVVLGILWLMGKLLPYILAILGILIFVLLIIHFAPL